MTIAITCERCGADVAFHISGETRTPRDSCPECGALYELKVRRVKGCER